MFPEWSWVLGLLIGACIGSFLNVVIYRMPLGLSLSDPPKSFCPSCKHSLGVFDLFPLLSWLFLRGRCRYCGKPVSSRYFFVELLTGSIWALFWYQSLVLSWDPSRAVCYSLAASALVAIVYIDWEHYIIPDEINAFLILPGVAYQVIHGRPLVAVYGALLGWGMLWGTALLGRALFGKDAMGHGDIKMMRAVGAGVGPFLVAVSYGIGIVVGLVVSVTLLFLRRPGPDEAEPSDVAAGAEDLGELKTFVYWAAGLLALPVLVCWAVGWPLLYGLLAGALGLMVLIVVRRGGGAAGQDEGEPAPESWGSLFLSGLCYLVLLDVVALFVPKLYDRLVTLAGEAGDEEADDFEVTAHHLPFGPYLALGSLACMLFGGPIVDLAKSLAERFWGIHVG